MKLSPTESKVYELIMDDPEHVWTLDQIADVVYEGSERPPHWRTSLTVIVRNVRLKTIWRRDDRVVKVSRYNGRGNKGKYALCRTAKRLGMDFV